LPVEEHVEDLFNRYRPYIVQTQNDDTSPTITMSTRMHTAPVTNEPLYSVYSNVVWEKKYTRRVLRFSDPGPIYCEAEAV